MGIFYICADIKIKKGETSDSSNSNKELIGSKLPLILSAFIGIAGVCRLLYQLNNKEQPEKKPPEEPTEEDKDALNIEKAKNH